MYSHQIERKLRDVEEFIGVFSINNIPSSVKCGKMVVNLDSNNLPGSHWIAINVDKNYVIYFDPLANAALPPILCDYLRRLKKTLYILTKPIQPLFSNTCAIYCINFIRYSYPSIFYDRSYFKRIYIF